MTAYAAARDLAIVAIAGWDDLADLGRNALVTGELLEQLATDGTLSDDADTAAATTTVFANINAVVLAVSRHTDSYLTKLYGAALPLNNTVLAATGLPEAVATMALGRLHGAGISDELAALVKRAETYLRDLASGIATLPITEPSTPNAPGKMHVRTKPGAFDWSKY